MKKIIVVGPALSRSGYGEMARNAIKACLSKPDIFDVYVQATSWGGNANIINKNNPDFDLVDSLIKKTNQYAASNNNQLSIDISVQVSLPTDWKKLAPVNIGYTAGIETNFISPAWLQTSNQMDKIIVISEHAKKGFTDTAFGDQQGNQFKVTTPVDVVHFPVKLHDKMDLGIDFEHDFNFLSVCQWGPRKNLEQTILNFLQEFKDEEVGLVLKVNTIADSIMDQETCEKRIKGILNNFPDRKCKVYLLHGYMSDKELNSLYSHPKIKAIISTTHGEGFGLPLFEASYNELPVLATDWSGHLDFLTMTDEQGKQKKMFAKIDYDLKPIAQEHVWQGVLEAGTSWAYPRSGSVKERMREVIKDYNRFKSWAKKLSAYNREKFTDEYVYTSFCESVLGEKIVKIEVNELPKISLFASVYKGDEYIEQYLDDVTRQTIFKDKCELVLINANSPGNEEEVIKRYMEKFSNIKYVRWDHDPGIYDTWNEAIKLCEGEFVTNANLDDRKAPWSIERHAKALYANKDVDLVYADSFILTEPNKRWEDVTSQTQRYNFDQFSLETMLRGNPPHNNPMWRKSLHQKFGWFDQKYKSAGDWDFWLRCAFGGAKFMKINDVLGVYYHNPKGMSTNPEHNSWKQEHEKEIFMNYKKKFLEMKKVQG